MNQPTLFDLPDKPAIAGPRSPQGGGTPRLRCADRQQVVFRAAALDELLSEDHPARFVWQHVEGLDFAPLHQQIRSVEGHAGRAPVDPKILMALWLFATLEGVGSARQLAKLCTLHAAYQWICGDVSDNYHGLSDFRTHHSEFLDQLLTESVATLMHEGLVTLERVAQDGMRVRASAGAASFRREKTLQQCLAEAEEQVQALRQELEGDPAAANKRQQAGARAGGQRMATDEAKEIYKERAARAECVNAIARNRGYGQFPIRGSPKARVIALWYALVHNVMRTVALREERAAAAH